MGNDLIDENKKFYLSPLDNKKRDEVLELIVPKKVILELWQKGGSEDEVQSFESIEYEDNLKILTMRPQGSILSMIKKSNLAGKEVLFKFSYDRFQYFSSSKLVYDESADNYLLKADCPFFVGQQRADYRLKANNYNKIKIKIGDKVIDGLDVSSGGMSFAVEPGEKDQYAKGSTVKNCTLNFNGKNFSIPTLLIASTFPIKESGKLGIGVKFADLSTKQDEELAQFVSGEARAEELRKKLFKKKPTT